MTNGKIQQIYPDSPHTLVTSEVNFEADSNRDFDLLATIQFVSNGTAVAFDFSALVLVEQDLSDLETERKRLATEIGAVNSLLEAVENFHQDFLTQASKSLDMLSSLQESNQS